MKTKRKEAIKSADKAAQLVRAAHTIHDKAEELHRELEDAHQRAIELHKKATQERKRSQKQGVRAAD